jgi:DDE family transposase
MAIVQAICGLAGRQTQGFLQSVFELMNLDLAVLDHSTLSRRRRQFTITLPIKDWSKSRHLVIDSTGVKVYGEGEWKVRQHDAGKRRTWLKLRFCADESTLEIISVVASTNDVSDVEALWPGRGLKPSASRRSSATGCKLGRSTINSKCCYSRVRY